MIIQFSECWVILIFCLFCGLNLPVTPLIRYYEPVHFLTQQTLTKTILL